jgi:hypothetical protein
MQVFEQSMRIRSLNRRLTALAAITIVFVGCYGGDRPKTIPIRGRVTLDGQPPGEVGKLHFTPTEAAEGYVKRPAMGGYDVDGVYTVMSWSPGDGLVPGHYTVNVLPGSLANTRVPTKYHLSGTSGLEVNVSADQDEVEFDIPLLTK